jgi:hypothetical protein
MCLRANPESWLTIRKARLTEPQIDDTAGTAPLVLSFAPLASFASYTKSLSSLLCSGFRCVHVELLLATATVSKAEKEVNEQIRSGWNKEVLLGRMRTVCLY